MKIGTSWDGPGGKTITGFETREHALLSAQQWIHRMTTKFPHPTQFLVCLDIDNTVLNETRSSRIRSGVILCSTQVSQHPHSFYNCSVRVSAAHDPPRAAPGRYGCL